MKKVNYVLTILIFVTFFVANPAGIIKGSFGGIELEPNEVIIFDQVDFLFPLATELDSDWGRVTVDPVKLYDDTGEPSGYVNIYTDVGWVVANLAIDLVDGIEPVTTYFTLYLGGHQEIDITVLSARVHFSLNPLETFGDGTHNDFLVGVWEWNAEGFGDGDVTSIGPPPPPISSIPGSPPDEKHVLPNPANVQTAKRQCFPMGIANSLQYLEDTYNVPVPHDHKKGLKGDNSLVGQLDTAANRTANARDDGKGINVVPMLKGKFEYLNANGLKDKLIHKHQGRGFGDLEDGDFEHKGIVSSDKGSKVTWEWICGEIKNGENVELGFTYPTGGGHVVRVIGCGITKGQRWLRYVHDALQTHKDPADNKGLENVKKDVIVDEDGFLHLGSIGHKVLFALSESKPCTDTPYYRQKKIVQVPIPWQFWAIETISGETLQVNIIDRIRISPTWLNSPSDQPAGEGRVFVQRWVLQSPNVIPLEALTWAGLNPETWEPVLGDPIEVKPLPPPEGDVALPIPLSEHPGAVLVAYEVVREMGGGIYEVVGHFINEAVLEWSLNEVTLPTTFQIAPIPTIVEILTNFDVHNNTDMPVTNFELDFEGLDFGCRDVMEAIGFVTARGIPPVPVPPEPWGANADNPLVVRPIIGGTEVKWIQPDRPLQPCEWLHVGLVFRMPGFIDDVNATVQGYWTTIISGEAPPPPPSLPPLGGPVSITVMPLDKVGLMLPWAALVGLLVASTGVVVLARRRLDR
jgi:hypothetical protein